MRALFLFIVLVGVPSALLDAAPVPKDLNPKMVFFPTALGTKWEYVREGTNAIDHTRGITRSERGKDDSSEFEETWSSVSVQYGKYHEYRLDKQGLSEISSGRGQAYQLPHLLFRFDTLEGVTWDAGVSVTLPGKQPWFSGTRGTNCEVVTPAGKFKASPVSLLNGRGEETTSWYSADVGVVKWASGEGKPLLLSKYTPGRNKK